MLLPDKSFQLFLVEQANEFAADNPEPVPFRILVNHLHGN
jgi:hypothetical protein